MAAKTGTRQRARRGSGSVRKFKSGIVQFRIDGKSYYGETQAEAIAKAKAARGKPVVTRGGPTVRDWLADWMERQKDHLEAQTWTAYDGHCRNWIVPILGKVQLAGLTPDHIDYLREKVLTTQISRTDTNGDKKTVSATTANHIHYTLSAALHDAVKRGLLASAVTTAVKAAKRDSPPINTFTNEELARILAAVKGDPLESLYVTATKLGMREGELLALKWRDVKLEGKGHIRVVANLVRALDGRLVLKDSKTANGRRTLTPLPESVRTALGNTPRTSDLVWPAEKGGLRDARRFSSHWASVRIRAGLSPEARFHDTRHTVATKLLDEGVAPQTVALVLGDTVQTIMSTYAHVTTRGLDLAMALIDASDEGRS